MFHSFFKSDKKKHKRSSTCTRKANRGPLGRPLRIENLETRTFEHL